MSLENLHSVPEEEIKKQNTKEAVNQKETKEVLQQVDKKEFFKAVSKAIHLIKLGYKLENDNIKLIDAHGTSMHVELKKNPKKEHTYISYNYMKDSLESNAKYLTPNMDEILKLVNTKEADNFLNQKGITQEQIDKEVQQERFGELSSRIYTLNFLKYFKGNIKFERMGNSLKLSKINGSQKEFYILRNDKGREPTCIKMQTNAKTSEISFEDGLRLFEDLLFNPESNQFIDAALKEREAKKKEVERIKAEKEAKDKDQTDKNIKNFERIDWCVVSVGIGKCEGKAIFNESESKGGDKEKSRNEEISYKADLKRTYNKKTSKDELLITVHPNKEFCTKHGIRKIELSRGKVNFIDYGYNSKEGTPYQTAYRLSVVKQGVDTRINEVQKEKEEKEKKAADKELEKKLKKMDIEYKSLN